ncbi:TOPB1-like protein [Mya arenaria]|uniref:TOPB1-like protein n=1 Tax=Mya arenaria TaxID=6604 RepID=A0ABY7FMB3_MYAAR|nr:TOPB1-like protein [Mya arenaria]
MSVPDDFLWVAGSGRKRVLGTHLRLPVGDGEEGDAEFLTVLLHLAEDLLQIRILRATSCLVIRAVRNSTMFTVQCVPTNYQSGFGRGFIKSDRYQHGGCNGNRISYFVTSSSALKRHLYHADMSRRRSSIAQPDKKVFLLSGFDAEERKTLSKTINQLGGSVLDCQEFRTTSSHIILGKLSRSEKYLGACATGKWALHPSYVRDSLAAGVFLDEEQYEWCADRVINGPGVDEELAYASRRWRFLLGAEIGAFSGWRVAVVTGPKRAKDPQPDIMDYLVQLGPTTPNDSQQTNDNSFLAESQTSITGSKFPYKTNNAESNRLQLLNSDQITFRVNQDLDCN